MTILTISFFIVFILILKLSRSGNDNNKLIGFILLLFAIEFFVFFFFISTDPTTNGVWTFKLDGGITRFLPDGHISISSIFFFIGSLFLMRGIISLLKDRWFVTHATEAIGTIVGRKKHEYNTDTSIVEICTVIITFLDGDKEVKAKFNVDEFFSTKHSNGMKIEIAYKQSLILRRYEVRGLDKNHRPESYKFSGILYYIPAAFLIITSILFSMRGV